MTAPRESWLAVLAAGDPLPFIVAAGLTAALLAFGLAYATASLAHPLRRRLQAVGRDSGPPAPSPLRGWLERLAPSARPGVVRPAARGLRALLQQAGYAGNPALATVYIGKLVLTGLAALALWWAAASLQPPASLLLPAALFGLFVLYMAWKTPNLVLEHRIEARKRRLLEGFPDVLDLLVVCTEAGLGFNAALGRVAEMLPDTNADLAHELGQVNAEVRAGVDRSEALRHLADRTGLDEIRGLVALMIQSSRFGTSISDTLRTYSDEFRDRRAQAAEELAAKVGTKLIFPLVLCIFPAFFLVAVGPAVVGVVRALARANLQA